ncbi:MAG: nucleotidyltransferase family protein [Candidatus Latescibacterota bacterium]
MLKIIEDILERYAPEYEVRAFGSRVTRTAKKHSDLDLAVAGRERIDPKRLDRLKEAFEESDLPFRVDVLDWNAISPEFRKIIEKKYEVIREGEKVSEYDK